jgi:hypothetical protein
MAKSVEYGKRGDKSEKTTKTGVQTPTAQNLPKPIQGVEGAVYVKGKPLSDNANFKKFR